MLAQLRDVIEKWASLFIDIASHIKNYLYTDGQPNFFGYLVFILFVLAILEFGLDMFFGINDND